MMDWIFHWVGVSTVASMFLVIFAVTHALVYAIGIQHGKRSVPTTLRRFQEPDSFTCRSLAEIPCAVDTPYEEITQQIEKNSPWLVRFRWGDDTAVLLGEFYSEDSYDDFPRTLHQIRFTRLLSTKHWMQGFETAFGEPSSNGRRDLYVTKQRGGPVSIWQHPKLTEVGSTVAMGDDMVCLYDVVLQTYAEKVTREKLPNFVV
jgi:hypothetical protein